MYALAAGATGVSLVSIAHPAEARVVYTPAHVPITGVYNLDLNHDGITDFMMQVHRGNSTSFRTSALWCSYGTNQHINSLSQPEDINPGFLIGAWAKDKFSGRGWNMAEGGWLGSKAFYRGHWANDGKGVKNRYLGLRFKIKGEYHYGWARLSVSFSDQTLHAVLTGYAYETIPRKAIVAGKRAGADDNGTVPEARITRRAPDPRPVMLGLLAMGARGLSIWRREDSAASVQ
jgi:hypothetical protein